ncbi:hypothetical protein GF312_20440 [Candidatus Poribacteria bacterium]|nr:hypothetical protein [Candidatus Poribacteria bacterium]
MDCRKVLSLMDEYLENKLPEEVSQEINLHTKECVNCMAEININRVLVSALSTLPDKKAPVRFADAVMNQVLTEYEESENNEDSESIMDRLTAFWVLTAQSVKPSLTGVKMMTRSFSFTKYIPRPTFRIRWGDDRQESLTKLPLAVGFRW